MVNSRFMPKPSVTTTAMLLAIAVSNPSSSDAFTSSSSQSALASTGRDGRSRTAQQTELQMWDNSERNSDAPQLFESATKLLSNVVATAAISASLAMSLPGGPAFAENELSAKYGGGFDSSLVDQTCLVDKCSLQAKSCLADDPSCRKGLTCTAKCLGDNACITGCMARYGNKNLDNLLKCTIEDNECIKVAILDGGADKYGEEPKAPAPTIRNFNLNTMEGTWYKVVGFNPNYDCYACQRNTFSVPDDASVFGNDKLKVDVEFSMPHLMPDGTPTPPKNVRENVREDDGLMSGGQSIGFNDYQTQETMVFDSAKTPASIMSNLVLNKGTDKESNYARTAHSEGEMFGLKFWENWYIIGENEPDTPEFKFVYYNGKTRQNTYEGAFVYSRTRELSPESMGKVYKIASDAGMNPDQFCKIRNGCFSDESPKQDGGIGSPSSPFQSIMASTKVSQFLGVRPVAAEGVNKRRPVSAALMPAETTKRAWWYEVGDYLENPHRHFEAMDGLRTTVEWPEDVRTQQ